MTLHRIFTTNRGVYVGCLLQYLKDPFSSRYSSFQFLSQPRVTAWLQCLHSCLQCFPVRAYLIVVCSRLYILLCSIITLYLHVLVLKEGPLCFVFSFVGYICFVFVCIFGKHLTVDLALHPAIILGSAQGNVYMLGFKTGLAIYKARALPAELSVQLCFITSVHKQ